MTRYEQIKAMSLEQMAAVLKDIDTEKISAEIKYCENHCPLKDKCYIDMMSPDDCYDIEYQDAMKVWLSQ